MKKTERLNGIIYVLKERGKMTAQELAEHFEVSMRTIYRDIDALSQLKVPIISHDGVLGGYEIDKTYFIPSITLNEQEVIMLLIVLNFGETIKLPNLTADYQLLKSKIINTLADMDREKVEELMKHIHVGQNRLEPSPYLNGLLHPVLDSFIETRNLDITYYNPKRDTYDERHVSPQNIFFEEGGWYMNAYCHLRQEKRCFRLDRIKKVQISPLENTYLNTPIKSATDKFKEVEYDLTIDSALFRVLKDNDYLSNIEITSSSQFNTHNGQIHVPINKSMIEPIHEWLRINVKTIYKQSIKDMVLSNPHAVTLHGPPSFLEEINKTTQELYKKYL